MTEKLHEPCTEPGDPEVLLLDDRSARLNHSAHVCLWLGPSYPGSMVAVKIKNHGYKSSCLPTSLHTMKDIIFSRVTV